MPSLLDDLKGILGKDEITKIEASLGPRLNKAAELLGYYEETDPPEVKVEPAKVTPPVTETKNPGMDMAALLAGIDKSLDTKLATIGTTMDKKIEDAIKARGSELVSSASMFALRQADQLNRIYMKHRTDFGEDFDSDKFNTFVEEQKKSGRNFKDIPEAYEAMTSERRIEKTVAERVREGLKAKASTQNVPGTTPPSVKSPLGAFMARGKVEGVAETAVSKAAAMLSARRAAANAEVQ